MNNMLKQKVLVDMKLAKKPKPKTNQPNIKWKATNASVTTENVQNRKRKPHEKSVSCLSCEYFSCTIPFRSRNTAEVVTPMAAVIPVLTAEEHHQCNYEPAIF